MAWRQSSALFPCRFSPTIKESRAWDTRKVLRSWTRGNRVFCQATLQYWCFSRSCYLPGSQPHKGHPGCGAQLHVHHQAPACCLGSPAAATSCSAGLIVTGHWPGEEGGLLLLSGSSHICQTGLWLCRLTQVNMKAEINKKSWSSSSNWAMQHCALWTSPSGEDP